MELEKIMKLKVILFTNEPFFMNFKNILLKLAYEIYINKQHNLLVDKIKAKNNNFLVSKWFYIMKLIFSKMKIPDFSNSKDLENEKEDYSIKNIKLYEIDKLQYLYLKKICLLKLKNLHILALKLKMSLINIIQIYIDLCVKEILINKNKYESKNNQRENGIINSNKIFPTGMRTNIKRRTIKIHTLLFNNNLKNELSTIKNNNKNKKQNDDIITNIISKNNNSIDLFKKRNNSAKQKPLYCNSFTRLFIGETDKDSILERHLSNILVLKQNNININGYFIDISEGYLKNIFKKIYKKDSQKLLIDNYLQKTLEKFEDNQKYLDEYNKKIHPKKSKKILIRKFSKLVNDINNIELNNKDNIENRILKTYNYKLNKNRNIKGLKKVNSEKTRDLLYSKNNKSLKKSENKNESSILIENLCKELSDSKLILKKLNNKKDKKNLWIKTNSYRHTKNKNYFFRNNNSYFNNFNTNCLSTNHKKKRDYKYFLSNNDLFFNNNIY